MDWTGIGALGGLCIAGITVLSFWMRFSDRITKAEAAAAAAKTASDEAQKSADEAQRKVEIQGAAFSIYREQIAREYIHREVMREVEERLTAAIERLGDRLDRVLERSDTQGRGDRRDHKA